MIKSKFELFENTRKKWPEKVQILEDQPYITWGGTVFTEPCSNEIYHKIAKKMRVKDDWGQVTAWAFNQAADKLARRKFKNSERVLYFKDVSFKSFNTKLLSNLSGDDGWAEELAIYKALPDKIRRKMKFEACS